MSSFIGARSGNRGRCAQPCRRLYHTPEDPKDSYRMSLKDNSSITLLKDLMELGVTSFKIEGRMKRPEYVGVVTKIYRKVMDAILDGSYDKLNLEAEEENLRRVFNRGQHPSYYFGKSENQFETKGTGNSGVFVGTAGLPFGKGTQIRSKEPIINGDGLRIVLEDGTVYGMNVSGIDDQGVINEKIPRGAKIYKTYDKKEMDDIAKTFANRGQYIKKSKVKLTFTAKVGIPLSLVMTHENGKKVEAFSDFVGAIAEKRLPDREKIVFQLSKFGGTPFIPTEVVLEIDDNVMVPFSECNQLRRTCVEQLQSLFKEEERSYERPLIKIPQVHRGNSTPKIGVFVESDLYYSGEGADFLIIEGEHFSSNSFLKNIHHAKQKKIPYYLAMPTIVKDAEYKNFLKAEEAVEGAQGIFVSNMGQWAFIRETYGEEVPLFANEHFNIANGFALKNILEKGIKGYIPSLECRLDQLSKMTLPETFLFVHGKIPVMITEQTMEEDLIDEKDMIFTTKIMKSKRSILYNSKSLSVMQDMGTFIDSGFGNFIIRYSDARESIDDWLEAYGTKIKTGRDPLWTYEDYTKGHYFRGAE